MRSLLLVRAVDQISGSMTKMVIACKVSKGFKTFFRAEGDQFAAFTLLKTTREQFVSSQGEPISWQDIEDEAVSGKAVQASYPWGEARFYQTEEGMLLYHLQTSSSSHKGPRNSQVGMDIKEVTDKFRDMGQLPNDRGDRGIYYDLVEGYARYKVASDNPRTGTLEYVYVGSEEASTTILRYDIVDGRVAGILMSFLGHRQSMVE